MHLHTVISIAKSKSSVSPSMKLPRPGKSITNRIRTDCSRRLSRFWDASLRSLIDEFPWDWKTIVFSLWPITSVCCSSRDPFYSHGLTVIPAWVSNHMLGKVLSEITYLFPNFNGRTVGVWKWIMTFTPHFKMDVSTYPRREPSNPY